MNNVTDIKYEEVKNKVTQIKNCSNTMDNLFNEFKGIMAAIYQDDVFQGTASNSLQEKFANLQKKFDGYVELVDTFASTIDKARAATESTEASIRSDAENLLN